MAVLIIFPVILQTIIKLIMLSIGEQGQCLESCMQHIKQKMAKHCTYYLQSTMAKCRTHYSVLKNAT